jgi:hypothetical protein
MLVLCLTKNKSDDSIHLLTGYEGNNTFIVRKVPTIIWGNAEENNWYRGENKGATIHTFALTKHYLIFSNDPCVKYSTSRNREVGFRWPVESLNKVFLLYPHLIFKVSRYY